MATTSTTSILNTPQAVDDSYAYTESDVLAANNILVLDVMSNDSGGKSKTLYAIEASEEFIQALATQDLAGEAYAQYFNGVKVWIENNKIMVDVSGADALAALGAQSIEDLDAGQQLNLSFSYTIRLGNGTLSVATVSLTISGESDTTNQPTQFSGDLGRSIEETDNVLQTGGTITAIDPEGFNTFQVQTDVTNPGGYGRFSITESGEWTYITHSAMNWLVAGQPVTESFTVKAHDGTERDISVTITGTDDEPTVTQADITGQVQEGGALTASGVFTMFDPDNAQGMQLGQWAGAEGAIGTLHVTQTASGTTNTFAWTYEVDSAAVEGLQLDEGQTATALFSVEVINMGDHMGGFPITITIEGADEELVIDGTPGNDFLVGTDAAETFWAGEGDDTIHALGGNDTIHAGDGDDHVLGGDGDDVIHLEGGSYQTANGGDGNDVIHVGEGSFVEIRGGAGDDALHGDNSFGYLLGGAGHDVIEGGSGGGFLYGEEGDDDLTAGAADTAMYDGPGSDTLQGGAGNDALYVDGVGRAAEDVEWLHGGAGDDYFELWNSRGTLNGGAGSDTMMTGGSNVTFVFNTPLVNEGTDILFVASPESWTVQLAASIYRLPTEETIEFASMDSVGNEGVARLILSGNDIYYDDNGGSTGDAQKIMSIYYAPDLDASHFLLI